MFLIRNYLNALRHHIKNAFIVFFLAFLLGILAAFLSPEFVESVFEKLEELIEPVMGFSRLELFVFVFLNNSFNIFVAAILGLFFGIFPIFFMFSNGLILGIVSYVAVVEHSLPFLLVGILPHGVLELPAAVIGAGIGLMLGDKVMGNVFREEKNEIKQETKSAVLFMIKFLLPIILIAAFIEVFITFRLM